MEKRLLSYRGAGLKKIAVLGISLCMGISGFALEIGEPLPEVAVTVTTGEKIPLKELAGGSGYTLVYFYPKADTPGCTAQACSLRDAYQTLQEKGVKVFGVSTDTVEAQKAFREKYRLPFELFSDPEGVVVRAFGVPTIPGKGFAKRQAYLFREGKLVWRDLSASTVKQAEDVLAVLQGEKQQ